MEIYFDNSATTQVSDAAISAVTDAMKRTYGNPSSMHYKGVEAERVLNAAREVIAKSLHASEKEIFFTSGGTESNNWALAGGAAAHRRRGNHIITTAIEHPSVHEPLKRLAGEGFEITYLPVDAEGRISLSDLENAVRKETILVSVMYVNNEVGSIEPVEEAAALIKRINREILFHVDAVQAYGKLPIHMGKLQADLLSASSHKIHGPKGTGFLYVRDKCRILPYILGGGQQKGMRSGTDHVPGAAGMAAAAAECKEALLSGNEHLLSLKNRLRSGLETMEGVTVNTPPDGISAPHILSASFSGIRSEVLLHALEERGICVSSGSACSTNKKMPVSEVLLQMHIPRDQASSTLRFSFGRYNTEEEVDYCLEQLRELLPVLRRFTRR